MSQFGDLEAELNSVWRALQNEWFETRGVWRDRVAEGFEREWWSEIEGEVPQMIASVSELDEIFRQIDMFLAD